MFCFNPSYGDFQVFCRTKKNKTYITKPESGCQGKGIAITKNPTKDIKPGEHMVCQQYLSKVSLSEVKYCGGVVLPVHLPLWSGLKSSSSN